MRFNGYNEDFESNSPLLNNIWRSIVTITQADYMRLYSADVYAIGSNTVLFGTSDDEYLEVLTLDYAKIRFWLDMEYTPKKYTHISDFEIGHVIDHIYDNWLPVYYCKVKRFKDSISSDFQQNLCNYFENKWSDFDEPWEFWQFLSNCPFEQLRHIGTWVLQYDESLIPDVHCENWLIIDSKPTLIDPFVDYNIMNWVQDTQEYKIWL